METTDRSTTAATADIKDIETRISDTDRRIAELFEERMHAVRDEELYRSAHGLPASDPARDADMLEKLSALISDDSLRAYYINFMRGMLGISDRYRHRLAKGMRIAYSGVEGAYANIAARKIFPDGKAIGFPGFGAAYDAVTSGECDCAVLPIENSYAGDVGQVIDLMYTGSLHVSGMYTLRVSHSLLCVPGATADDIRKVVSHPQALMQSSDFLNQHDWQQLSMENNAVAAQKVRDEKDPSQAAVAGEVAGEIYGLKKLAGPINNCPDNTTRFLILAKDRVYQAGAEKISLCFELPHRSGTLYSMLGNFIFNDVNMRMIESRPIPEESWQYRFFVDIEGNLEDAGVQNALYGIMREAKNVKILGNY